LSRNADFEPATISTHRVKLYWISGFQNQYRGLKQLSTLPDKILITWPEVEFMTSVGLGDLINKEKKS
jgi:hypothetical protein